MSKFMTFNEKLQEISNKHQPRDEIDDFIEDLKRRLEPAAENSRRYLLDVPDLFDANTLSNAIYSKLEIKVTKISEKKLRLDW